MIGFLRPFLIFIVIYHILVTVIGYGVLGGAYPQLPALARDAIRLLFFAIIIGYNFKSIVGYLRIWKRPRITLIILILFGTGMSLLKGKSMIDIFIGIKYGLLYLFIFLSSTVVGRLFTGKSTERFVRFLKYMLITTVIVGFLRQGLKCIRPDLFMSIGYGPLKDFVFGVKPPIYYLTGYKGTLRRQGIFSGPNNYGYFLIAFLPAIMIMCGQKFESLKEMMRMNKKSILNIAVIITWIVAIILTLSRTAFIGGIIGIAMLNMQRIKKHKKISWGILLLVIAGLAGLSILKGASTIGHIQAKLGSIKYVIQQPSGYGLGTSGPSVHHNGTILPENYYIQLMLDIGTLGFLLRAVIILQITSITKRIQQRYKTLKADIETQMIYRIRRGLNIGRISLLIMGLFLHVFEDSMVNYLFFIARGILTGYLSAHIKENYQGLMTND